MKITRKRIATTIAGLGLAGIALVPLACSNQLKDLGGIGQTTPDYAVTILNVDSYPNITELCYQGVAFATTTRDYNSIMRVPEWDAFCRTQIGHASNAPAGSTSIPVPASTSTP